MISSTGFSNTVGNDFQNFNPITNGLDFVTVHSSETLKPKLFNFGVFYNIATNTLPYFESGDGTLTRNRSSYSDSVGAFDLNIGYGIRNNWDVGVNFPFIANQKINSDQIYGNFSKTGITEIRLNTKYRFFGDETKGLAAILSANINQLENNVYTGDGAGTTFNIEVAGDKTFGKWSLAGNLGYRLRSPGDQVDPIIEPFDDALIGSIAASRLLSKYDTKLIFEIFGSVPTSSDAPSGQSSFEGLLGVKHDLNDRVALHGGLGTELSAGTSSPDWRFYVGLNYVLPIGKNEDTKLVETRTTRTFPTFDEDSFEDDQYGLQSELKDLDNDITDKYNDFDIPEEQIADVQPTVDIDDPYDEASAIDRILAEPKKKKVQTFTIQNVNFKSGSFKKVYGKVKGYLRKLSKYLKRPPRFKGIVIIGHTDSVGKTAYNKRLSLNRARTIAKYLMKVHKIPRNKIKVRGYGESRPIADNGNYQGRRKNRRVEFRIYNQ